MKKVSKKIIELLSENMSDASDSYSDTWKDPLFENFKVAQVEHYGGENKGSDYYNIFKLTDKDTKDEFFIKFDGYYQSYVGTEWQSVAQVVPYEKTVKDWKEVK